MCQCHPVLVITGPCFQRLRVVNLLIASATSTSEINNKHVKIIICCCADSDNVICTI